MSSNALKQLNSLRLGLVKKPYQDEAGFKEACLTNFSEQRTPAELAYVGGALADRLAFLFVTGYQSAVKHTFHLTSSSWAVLAVSEDQSTDSPKPPLAIDGQMRLSGYKTWVACSAVTDQIIVSIGDPKHGEYRIIDRNRPGLTIQPKTNVKFLADMSQGIAEFRDLQSSSADLLPTPDIKLFAKREPLYLYISFCGFLAEHFSIDDANNLLERLLSLVDSDFTSLAQKTMFAEIDSDISRLFKEIPETAFAGSYDDDKGILGLYSKVIQKRAGNL